MKKIRKGLSFVLVVVMMLTILPMTTVKSNASTNHTLTEAINWIKDRGNENWWQDVDGAYGCQCVDLIYAYYEYLVGYRLGGNAKDYLNSSKLPSGWWMDSTPSEGAIIVWDGNTWTGQWTTSSNGHVGLVYAVSGSNVYTVETNTGKTDGQGDAAAAKFRTRVNCNAKYIHPDFSNSSAHGEMTTPTISLHRDYYFVGDTIDISWEATSSNTDFYQYWLIIANETNGKSYYCGETGNAGDVSANHYSLKNADKGNYKITVYAVPYYNKDARQKISTKTFEINNNEMTTPAIYFDKQNYYEGDTVNISWEATSSNTDFYQYWLILDNDTNGKRYYFDATGNAGDINANHYSLKNADKGNYRITVYAVPYYNKDVRQKIYNKSFTVNDKISTVSTIKVQSQPTKTTYTVGETFNSSGLSIKVNMSDGTSKTVTDGFIVTAPDMSTAGTKTVNVTYNGVSTSYQIIVLDVMLGDLNGNGKVNAADYAMLVNYVMCNMKMPSDEAFLSADINKDGVVDAFDAIMLDLYLNDVIDL